MRRLNGWLVWLILCVTVLLAATVIAGADALVVNHPPHVVARAVLITLAVEFIATAVLGALDWLVA